jgi:hypothetical protein
VILLDVPVRTKIIIATVGAFILITVPVIVMILAGGTLAPGGGSGG